MESLKAHLRVPVVALLVLAVLSVFTFSSFAAPEARAGLGRLVGTLTGVSDGATLGGTGKIYVNGNGVQAGATVLSGTTISTGDDGNAIIDMGAMGKVELRPNSSVTLTFSPGRVQINTRSSSARLAVTRGVAEVRSPEMKSLKAGEDSLFNGAVEASTNGDTDVVVDCGTQNPAGGTAQGGSSTHGGWTGPGAVGLIMMGGVAAGAGLAGYTIADNKEHASTWRP